jgi:alkylation response protein AidB-like acyl-CoA dehydrogenase
MDTVGNKVAKKEIAMIKVAAPNMACQVIDWAMQVHGGAGVSDDFPLAARLRQRAHHALCRRPRRGAPQPDRQVSNWRNT